MSSRSTEVVETTAPAARVEYWLDAFAELLERRDIASVPSLFRVDSYWRDIVSFTWNITTVEGIDGVIDLLTHTLEETAPHDFRAVGDVSDDDGVLSSRFTFETSVGRGTGHLRLTDGLAWTIMTSLDELIGYEESTDTRRPMGAEHGARRDRVAWSDARAAELAELGSVEQPYVLIVGGGQGGVTLAARLRQMDVPTIVIDRHDRPGGTWRSRYKSLCLHDPVHLNHLPYMEFPSNWPIFAPKDKLASWLESYVAAMEIDYWGSTNCVSASYDESAKVWNVVVDRAGERIVLRPTQLVFAMGISGNPHTPVFPGMERFTGVQQHSSDHSGPEGFEGKKAVVIGSNNSAHDIAAALWEAGVEVTMVQRSPTTVVRSETLVDVALAGLYSEQARAAGVTTEIADTILASIPYGLMAEFQKPISDLIRERDADFYARLDAAGFKLDFGHDESGLVLKYYRRASGYYIDVGASDLVADGEIRLAHGDIREITENSVVLEDGTELEADLIVYATGFRSMNEWLAELISPEVADRVGRIWGLGSDTEKDPGPWEGEERNLWKPTQQEGLWIHGGNLQMARYYSRVLALQLKARFEGIDTPVYALQPVHHTA